MTGKSIRAAGLAATVLALQGAAPPAVSGTPKVAGTAVASQAALPFVGPEWSIALVGDFNGDGRSDLLFRRTDGVNYVWLMNDATIVDQGTLPPVGPTWSVVAPK